MRFDYVELPGVVEENGRAQPASSSSAILMPMLEPLAAKLVDDKTVEEALGQLLSSNRLRSSTQLRHFLTFVIEESLAGRGDKLKAYTIATCALGRPADFDPNKDPIVRVEATRMRAALTAYYAGEGRAATIRFHLLPGSYRPMIEVRAPSAREARTTTEVQPSSGFELVPSPSGPPANVRSRWIRALLFWCAITALLIAYTLSALREDLVAANGVVQVAQQVTELLRSWL